MTATSITPYLDFLPPFPSLEVAWAGPADVVEEPEPVGLVLLPVPVAVLIVVLVVLLPAAVWARIAPDVVLVVDPAEDVVADPDPDSEELPSQVPLLLMLCQSPVMSE